jgi:hypothetical protein
MSRNGDDCPEFYSAKQLASILKRSVGWIYAAKRRGFRMPGNRATLEALVLWLDQNPNPRGEAWKRQQTAGNGRVAPLQTPRRPAHE